ncbi:MAG: hemolysin family protein [Syntrophobacteraceae bacterium]|jgi:putative hemolysin
MMFLGILYLVIVLLLLLTNGLLAMSELAVVSSSKTRLQSRAEEGDANARAALDLASNPSRFLATVQIGITLIGVLSGAFGGAGLAGRLAQPLSSLPYLGRFSESISMAVVIGFIAYLSLLAELVPKRIAVSSPEGIASAIAKPMARLAAIGSPVIHALGLSTDLVLRLFRFKQVKRPPVTEEEIRLLIGQATVAGVFEEAEQDMVERVFRLGDRRVGAMMTPRNKLVWLEINDPAEKTRRKIARSRYSRFPVRQKPGNIQGIVHVRDIAVRCLSGKPLDLKASIHKPIFVHENARALRVLELFKESGLQMALVVDEYGTVEGIITLTDILEGIVGDIPSEEVIDEPQIVRLQDGEWSVEGMLPIDELKYFLHLRKLPGERTGLFRTLGGFTMSQLKRVPAVSDRFECCGHSFEVVEMEGRRVRKVLVKKLPESSE